MNDHGRSSTEELPVSPYEGDDTENEVADARCHCCGVFFHLYRPRSTCNVCRRSICEFCCATAASAIQQDLRGEDKEVACIECCHQTPFQPTRRSFSRAFSSLKLWTTASRSDKWMHYCRSRRRHMNVRCSHLPSHDLEQLLSEHYSGTSIDIVQQKLVDRDVERTFQQLSASAKSSRRSRLSKDLATDTSTNGIATWRASVHRILSTQLWLKPQVGYCQGMTHIVALLVRECKYNSEGALRLWLAVSERFELDAMYAPSMENLHLRLFQLDEVFRFHLPVVHQHLSEREVHPSAYATRWVLTLFTDYRVLNEMCVIRFLDVFFQTGWKAFFRVYLAILATIEDALLRCRSSSDVLSFFSDVRHFFARQTKSDTKRFLSLAHTFKVTNRHLLELQQEYCRPSTYSLV